MEESQSLNDLKKELGIYSLLDALMEMPMIDLKKVNWRGNAHKRSRESQETTTPKTSDEHPNH